MQEKNISFASFHARTKSKIFEKKGITRSVIYKHMKCISRSSRHIYFTRACARDLAVAIEASTFHFGFLHTHSLYHSENLINLWVELKLYYLASVEVYSSQKRTPRGSGDMNEEPPGVTRLETKQQLQLDSTQSSSLIWPAVVGCSLNPHLYNADVTWK